MVWDTRGFILNQILHGVTIHPGMKAFEPALRMSDEIMTQELDKLIKCNKQMPDVYSFCKTWFDNWRHDDNPFEEAIAQLNEVDTGRGASENLNKLPAVDDVDLGQLFVDFNRCHCCSFYIEQERNAVICQKVGKRIICK